jgi:transcriptional regulator with XRE-family HTH domain
MLGFKSTSTISRLEKGEQAPSRSDLLSLEIIFGAPPKILFPEYYRSVEDTVMRRAAAFAEKIEARLSPAAGMKRKLLEAMISRTSGPEAA